VGRGEKSDLLHEGFPKLGAPLRSSGVLHPKGWYLYIGRRILHLYIN
jgi:hypothetical protein